MSFRKRSTVITNTTASLASGGKPAEKPVAGVRPSPLDGRPTTSTGTTSLDTILGGHAGLPLGTCLLIEEDGTTDFSGILLRYYAAEGLVQGHRVHALALHPEWKSELPGLSSASSGKSKTESFEGQKMKIAWRYEALASGSPRRVPERRDGDSTEPFCHMFDLKKRLSAESIAGEFFSTDSTSALALPLTLGTVTPPFVKFITNLQHKLASSPPDSIHRVIIPSLLSPTLYPPSSSHPSQVLQFIHSLRALLCQHPTQMTAMITLPLSLYPRSTGPVKWMEHLCDGVMEMLPIRGPITLSKQLPDHKGRKNNKEEEEQQQIQGFFKVHTLPVFHERGGGGAEGHATWENWAFSLSARRGLVIMPYALPPVEDEDQKEKERTEKKKKKGGKGDEMEF